MVLSTGVRVEAQAVERKAVFKHYGAFRFSGGLQKPLS